MSVKRWLKKFDESKVNCRRTTDRPFTRWYNTVEKACNVKSPDWKMHRWISWYECIKEDPKHFQRVAMKKCTRKGQQTLLQGAWLELDRWLTVMVEPQKGTLPKLNGICTRFQRGLTVMVEPQKRVFPEFNGTCTRFQGGPACVFTRKPVLDLFFIIWVSQ